MASFQLHRSGLDHVRRGDYSLVDKFTKELIDFQQKHDRGPSYIAMSLCDLAARSKDFQRFSYQLFFTQLATALAPQDGWSWIQHADALARNRRFDESLEACTTGSSLGDEIVAKAVQANALSMKLQFGDSLAIYDALISQRPDEIVLHTSRADTLKAMGRLPESLRAYDEVLERFPNSSIAVAARADVLRLLNRHSEALSVYAELISQLERNEIKALVADEDDQQGLILEETFSLERLQSARAWILKEVGQHDEALRIFTGLVDREPNDIVAMNGKAEALKCLGRYEEAKDVLNAAINKFPDDPSSRRSRAGLFLLLKRWDDAFADVPDQICVTRSDWIAMHVRGMVYLRKGDIGAAARLFERALQNTLPPPIADYFRNGLALCKLQRRQYSDALLTLNDVSMPTLLVPANVIRIHILGQSGQRRECEPFLADLRRQSNSAFKSIAVGLESHYLSAHRLQRDEKWVEEIETALLLAA